MISIRRARPSDRATLLALQRAILPSDAPIDPDGPDVFWLVLSDSTPVAFASIRCYASTSEAYLSRAGVLPSARGQGLQRRLINVRVRYARSLGIKIVITDTSRDNVQSSNSLIASGFKLFNPAKPWAFRDGLYWFRRLTC